MTAYRGYITVWGDEGTRLGRKGLEPVVANLNGHTREADDQGWRIDYPAFSIMSHLGKPVIRLEVDEAWQARLAHRVARRFLTDTGWKFQFDLNANTRRAL